MKARVYLSLGALLLFLAPLSCSDKAESPAPETPPEEQPTPEPEPEKPEFVDKGYTMEENIDEEDPDCYYTYFRMQNASQENVIFFISTKMSASGDQIVIAPGETRDLVADDGENAVDRRQRCVGEKSGCVGIR